MVSQAPGSGNNNWWVAKLSAVNATTGDLRQLAAPKHQIANPRWSPDGSTIAYIGGLMSDQGVTGGDLFVVPAGGGTPKNLTPRLKSSIASFSWTNPETVVAASYAQGSTQISTRSRGAISAMIRARFSGTVRYFPGNEIPSGRGQLNHVPRCASHSAGNR